MLREIDADPEAIAAQVEEEADKGERTDIAPSLSPDAKAALLAAYDESRELGASYVGPEHVLLALARDNDSEAGRLLERFGASHTKLRGGVIRGVEPTGGAREMSRTPRLDEYGRDLTQEAREGKLDPVIGRADEIDQAIEILSRRTDRASTHLACARSPLASSSVRPSVDNGAAPSASNASIAARSSSRAHRTCSCSR